MRPRPYRQEQIAEAHRSLVSMLDSHTRTAGPHDDGFQDRVQELVALRWAAEQEQIMDRLALQQGQANPESAAASALSYMPSGRPRWTC